MDVYSPFERVPFSDVTPAEIVALESELRTTVALSVLVGGRQVGFLLLEGPNAGRIKYLFDGTVLRFRGAVQLSLRYSSDSLGWEIPDADLVAAIDGDETYFMFREHGVLQAANVRTGVASKPPHDPCYVKGWAIRSDMQTEPLLQSQP